MKIIFLDIDGVLNADDDFGIGKENPQICGFRGISSAKVQHLKRIVDATGAKIVLVSTWKHDYEDYLENGKNPFGKYLAESLAAKGLTIFDTTILYAPKTDVFRGHEIKRWITHFPGPIESWVVLDDEFFPDYSLFRIRHHLVRTEEPHGLTYHKASLAISRLNNGEIAPRLNA